MVRKVSIEACSQESRHFSDERFKKHMEEVGDVENCSVTILEYTDHFEIEKLADTSYRDRGLLLL